MTDQREEGGWGGRRRLPFPSSHFHLAVMTNEHRKQQDEMQQREKDKSARRRHQVVVRVQSIEENEVNLKE
jgi:hypothetical protein